MSRRRHCSSFESAPASQVVAGRKVGYTCRSCAEGTALGLECSMEEAQARRGNHASSMERSCRTFSCGYSAARAIRNKSKEILRGGDGGREGRSLKDKLLCSYRRCMSDANIVPN